MHKYFFNISEDGTNFEYIHDSNDEVDDRTICYEIQKKIKEKYGYYAKSWSCRQTQTNTATFTISDDENIESSIKYEGLKMTEFFITITDKL
jgi:hypothetical protein